MKKVIVVFLCVCIAFGSCTGAFAASEERMIRGYDSRADQSGASVDPGKGGASAKNRADQSGASVDPGKGGASAKNRAARQGRASAAYGDDAYLLELLSDFMRRYENPEDQLGMWLADAYENGLFSEVDSPEKGYWLEETADDVEKISAEDQERLLLWAKENAEEQLIQHEYDARISQKEEVPGTIAKLVVSEKELRNTVIKDSIKRYETDASRCPFLPIDPPNGFFEQNVDKSVEYLRDQRDKFVSIERQLSKGLKALIPAIIRQRLIPVWLCLRIWIDYCCGLKLGYNALMGSKMRFKYKLNG